MQRLAGLMPSILLVLHLMPRRAGGCLAAKSAKAHTSANSLFERKALLVHGCWAFRGTIHLLHTKLELDLLSIRHQLLGRSSPPSNVDVSNFTPSLDQSIHRRMVKIRHFTSTSSRCKYFASLDLQCYLCEVGCHKQSAASSSCTKG